jgi:hypothetical protein
MNARITRVKNQFGDYLQSTTAERLPRQCPGNWSPGDGTIHGLPGMKCTPFSVDAKRLPDLGA